MSRILPILFNTEMIRAILDGRKTCTRRIAKKVPKETYRIEEETQNGNLMFQCIWGGYMPDVQGFVDGYTNLSPPYQPGDILWVRETWCWCPCWDCGLDTEEGCCDKETDRIYHPDRREYGCYGYKASFQEYEEPFERWHPSIHMPRKAARIFLVVKNVKLEPLQDITITEIRNEGLSSMAVHAGDTEMAMAEWKSLWNGTVKKNDLNRYGWEANPWVWVIEFERIDRIVGGETNGQENSGTVHRCLCTDQGDGSGDSKVEEKERSNSGFCPGQ